MYQSYLFAKQKNILSKYKKVASLATAEQYDTFTKKLLPFVSTAISYASDFSSAGHSTSTGTTRATATGQERSQGDTTSQQRAGTGRITRSATAAGSTAGSTTQRNNDNASGSGSDNEEGEPREGEEYVFRSSYTRKCKLRTVLFLPNRPREEVAEVDEATARRNRVMEGRINEAKEFLQAYLLELSKNYSIVRHDAMTFMHWLLIDELDDIYHDPLVHFNPTNFVEVALCFRLMLPSYLAPADNEVRTENPRLYNHILVKRDQFDGFRRNQNGEGLYELPDIRREDNILSYLAHRFANDYIKDVKNHLVIFDIYLKRTIEGFIRLFRIIGGNPQPANEPTSGRIASIAAAYILSAANDWSAEVNVYENLFGANFGTIISEIHHEYIELFAGVTDRSAEYVKNIENLVDTYRSIIFFNHYLRGKVEQLQDFNEARIRSWSVLPLPTHAMVHVPLSKNVIIYKVLRAVHDRLPTIWDEYPMPTRAILNNNMEVRSLIDFNLNYNDEKAGIWDSLFNIRGKWGAKARQDFIYGITTDGHAISFHFEKERPQANLIPTSLDDLRMWVPNDIDVSNWSFGLLHLMRLPSNIPTYRPIIGIDPGLRSMVYCTSEHVGNFRTLLPPGKAIRRATSYEVTNKDYQDRRGGHRATQLELGRRNMENMQEEVYDRIDGTRKTGSIQNLTSNLQSYNDNNVRHRMIEFNNGLNHRETKMYLFSQKQVALTSVAQEIETLGAKTHLSSHNHNQMAKMQGYPTKGTSKRDRRQNWIRKKSTLVNAGGYPKPILAYGDARLVPSMKGHAPLPVKYVREFLARKMLTIMVDEFRTSKMCSQCGNEMIGVPPVAGQPGETAEERFARFKNAYPLKLCVTCRTIWDRDYNAARNIRRILCDYIDGGFRLDTRPRFLVRPQQQQQQQQQIEQLTRQLQE